MLLYKILIDFDSNIRPFKYTLNFSDGATVSFFFRKEHLKHLLGIHYTSHSQKSASLLYQMIKKKKITLHSLSKDKNFSDIEDRVLNFSSLKYLLDPANCKDIILFDNTKLSNCNLKSKYILFDKKTNMTLHLGISDSDGCYYPETWIIETKKPERYTINQTILPVSLTISKR